MKFSNWIGPAAGGAIAGAIVVTVFGFNWGGWTLRHNANEMASLRADEEVVAALLPICLEQSRLDPRAAETLAALKTATVMEREAMLISSGWATMPGTTNTNRSLVRACAEKLGGAS